MTKVILCIILALSVSGLSLAQQTVKGSSIVITWWQPMQPEIVGWTFYASPTPATGYNSLGSVVYEPDAGMNIEWRDSRYPDLPAKQFKGTFVLPETLVFRGGVKRVFLSGVSHSTDRSSLMSNEFYIDVDLRTVKAPILKLIP